MRTICHAVVAATLLAASCLAKAQDAGTERPLPDINEVLKQIAAQAAKEDDEEAFKQHYTYHRARVKETRNGKGELKKREEKNRVYVPKSSTSDNDDPDDDESGVTDGQSATNLLHSGRGKAFEKSDFAVTDELISRFEFTLVARETIRERPVLVIDFRPADKDLPEKSIKDKFINKAAGRVWVDEEDYALVKVDLHLTDRVNVVGGLVGAVWKLNYKFDRERTEEGYWFVRNCAWHMEGRQVFVRRTMDYRDEKTDVKKYPFSEQARKETTTQ